MAHLQDGVVAGRVQYGGLVDVRDVVRHVALHAEHIPVEHTRASETD